MKLGRTIRAMVLVVTMAAAGLVGVASNASATDVGGNGNPAVSCPNGYTVKSANIYRSGTNTVIGQVEIRWSWACSGNWTRTTSYLGVRHLFSTIAYPSGSPYAYGDDYGYSQNWSPYIRVASNQTMCATGWIEDNGWHSATVCA